MPEGRKDWRFRARVAGSAVVALLVAAGCQGQGSSGASPAAATCGASATIAADCDGIDGLIAAAKKEGRLNVIALPAAWANYGAIISGFTGKYGIKVNSINPNGSSQDEINAIKELGGNPAAPDVVDLNMKFALANAALFAPYKVINWADILDPQKEQDGRWVQGYGGYMSIGYNSTKVPGGVIASVLDLLGPGFKGKVALAGDPMNTNWPLNPVLLATIANGGTADDVSNGVDFFHLLKQKGNLLPYVGTSNNIKDGKTPVVFQWDYLSVRHRADVSSWNVYVPTDSLLGGFYAQAINKQAPHPAAARLWEEYLFSDEGQNLWLKGGVHPARQAALVTSGAVDVVADGALPLTQGTPIFPTPEQYAAAESYLAKHW